MRVTEELRAWQAQQRAQAREKLLAEGMSATVVEQLVNEAQAMHEAQAECAARMVNEAPAVVVH